MRQGAGDVDVEIYARRGVIMNLAVLRMPLLWTDKSTVFRYAVSIIFSSFQPGDQPVQGMVRCCTERQCGACGGFRGSGRRILEAYVRSKIFIVGQRFLFVYTPGDQLSAK